jgi:hypothetical protein
MLCQNFSDGRKMLFFSIIVLLVLGFTRMNAANNQNMAWFKNAGYGVFVHYLYDIQNNPDELHSFGKQTSWDVCVNDFNVDTFAKQMSQAGAGYVIFTMHQRTRFLIAPNRTFDIKTGYRPGEACSTRDLVDDLYQALSKYNIPILLYWTGDGPRQDKQAATGLKYNYDTGSHTQVNTDFIRNWAEVVSEYGQRYKNKVVGWWVDGCYQSIGYDESKLSILAKGLKSGNPDRIIALNNGVQDEINFYSEYDDFTCGESSEFKDVPTGPLENGKQWHILSYFGTWWCQPGTRFKKPYMIDYLNKVKSSEGVVSIDVMLYRDGSIDQTQLELLKAIKIAVKPAK